MKCVCVICGSFWSFFMFCNKLYELKSNVNTGCKLLINIGAKVFHLISDWKYWHPFASSTGDVTGGFQSENTWGTKTTSTISATSSTTTTTIKLQQQQQPLLQHYQLLQSELWHLVSVCVKVYFPVLCLISQQN